MKLQVVLKITKRSILTLRPAILSDQSPCHCIKMKCFIVVQLKRNLVKVLIKCYPIESRGLNTVLRALSGNSRDGVCFTLDKQTWPRKNHGTQKRISETLLLKIR